MYIYRTKTKEDKMYSIWVLEYGHVYDQALGSVLSGQFNKGTCELTFTYTLLKGNGRCILIDTGTNGNDPVTQQYHERDGLKNWQGPEHVLAKVGVKPEDVDTVLITHAHYDHMDNLSAFPNAHFYIQEREIMGWVWAMTREKRFRMPNIALKPQNILDALRLCDEGRMHLVDGEMKNILPDIDLIPAFDGHTFGSQIIAVHNGDDTLAFVGDVMYLRESLTGIGNDGRYVPVGMGTGNPFSQMKTFEEVVKLVGGKTENIVIGHSPEIYEMYPSKTWEDKLSVAQVALADGDTSIV